MILSSEPITWTENTWASKYLGVWICAGKKFAIDLTECRRNFFSSVNCILNKANSASDLLKLQLVESYCLPILTYAMESFNLKVTELAQINYWWNSVYRKLFNYNKWELVRLLICKLQRLDFINIYYLRKISFIKNLSINLPTSRSKIMEHFTLHYINGNEYLSLFHMHGISSDWSMGRIKATIYINFELSIPSSVFTC